MSGSAALQREERPSRVITTPLGRRPTPTPRAYKIAFVVTAAEDELLRDTVHSLGMTVSEACNQGLRLWFDSIRMDLAKDRAKRRKPSKPGITTP